MVANRHVARSSLSGEAVGSAGLVWRFTALVDPVQQALDALLEIIALVGTAWADERGGAETAYRANYMCFHRFEDFRRK